MELTGTPRLAEIKQRLERVGQAHVLRFYDTLDAQQQRALLAQIASLDLDGLPGLIERYVKARPGGHAPGAVRPAPYYARDGGASGNGRAWDRAAARARGEALLRAGKIGAFTVAGGQGTRLGFDGPKGTYFGTALSRKPLFQCLSEWIIATQRRYGGIVPWYIMTSPQNHEETVAFFKQHGYFGLRDDDVMFFAQGVMPSLDMQGGRLLLENAARVATNPDGHGGSLRALYASGAVDDLRGRGVEHLSYVQIDNPLARVIDPVFIGLHVGAPDSSAEMSSKMVPKAHAGEKVGVFCRVGDGQGLTSVIEYSDLPRDLMEKTDERGRLVFNAGSIAIHMLGVEFVARLNEGSGPGGGFALPLHRAEKKVPFVDLETGRQVQPQAPNAVKLEAFVFDALPLCRSSIVYEADRIDEFAPIKNADGPDSPATCRDIQTERAARWLESKGVTVPRDASGKPRCTLELGPLTAMDPTDLDRAVLPPSIAPGAELVL